MPRNREYREILSILRVMRALQDRLIRAKKMHDWDYANQVYQTLLPTERMREAHRQRLRKYQDDAAMIGRALGIPIPEWETVTPVVFHSTLIPLYAEVAALKLIEPDWGSK